MPVRAMGLAGGPPIDFITAGLVAEGIEPRFQAIAGVSRVCTAVVELDRHRATEINEPGPQVTSYEAHQFAALFTALVADVRAVALCGSLPAGLPDDYYAALIATAHAEGAPVVLDTSGRALEPGIMAMPLLVTPNAREAGALLGLEIHDAERAVQAGQLLRERGARMAAITLGANGAVLVHEAGAWLAQTDRIEPLSTVGCGDAFVAGFIAALCAAVDDGESPTIEAAAGRDDVAVRGLILGTASGAANALTLGAGRVNRDDVMRCRRGVVVHRVA
jgi:tagatose 6-phosphate kinase